MVIQSSPMAPDVVDTWRAKLNLPSAIGTITGDIDAVRWDWGVKALPWLILADPNHVVTSEGLSFEEQAH